MGDNTTLGLFPPGSGFDGGVLTVGGCRLDRIAAEFGTPVMIVDEDSFEAGHATIRRAFERSGPTPMSLSRRKRSRAPPFSGDGRGRPVSGRSRGGEIVSALSAGADPARMLLHGNAKTDEELELAVASGIGLIVIDNFDDIDRLERIVPSGSRQPCLVRVIPGVQADTHAAVATGHEGSKFGLPPADARAAIARVRGAAGFCDATVSTPTSVRRSWTPTNWRRQSSRWPNSAASTCTTSAADSASATASATNHRPSRAMRRP